MNLQVEHRLRNDPAEAQQIGPWIEEFARRAGLSKAVQHALDLSLTEWITNVISYAYEDSRDHWIRIRLIVDGAEVRAEVEDDGREFNPLSRPPVDTSASLETRPIGGLGIHLMRRSMDEVRYRREQGRNIVSLIKCVK